MKTPRNPISPPGSQHQIDADTFDIDESEDIIGLAKTLVNGRHAGILTTVNEDGKPEVRWMATLAFDEFPIFYGLTAPESRKVRQIEQCPDVNWMFFNGDLSLVLNLVGTARILRDHRSLRHAWKQVKDLSHAYFLKQFHEGADFVVIETKVRSIVCTSPKNGLEFAIQPSELAHW